MLKNKYRVTLLMTILIPFVLVGCKFAGFELVGQPDLKKEEAKVNYAVGMQIGANLKQLNLKSDSSAILMGVADALEGKDPRVSGEEIRAAIMKVRFGESALSAKEDGIKYLEEHKSKDGVKVTDSGLQYEVVEEGKGAGPKDTDWVKVNYKGTFIDGKVFDESKGQPAEFPVNGIIKGWSEALKMMKPGAKWKLTIPADLAYGASGTGPIPANSVLLFDVELVDVVKKGTKGK